MRPRGVAFAALTLVAAGLAAATLSGAGTGSAPLPAPWATLAFARSDVAGGGVYLAGRGEARVLRPGAAEPAWSPDGRRLAYVAAAAGGAGDVFVVDADGERAGLLMDAISSSSAAAGS